MYFYSWRKAFFHFLTCFLLLVLVAPPEALAIASNNIPLDSPVYYYLDKLASFGFIASDFKGIKPITKAEATRLLFEAEKKRAEEEERTSGDEDQDSYAAPWDNKGKESLTAGGNLAREMIHELRHYLQREIRSSEEPESIPKFDIDPISSFRIRYVYLDGTPRSYERSVNDPGGDKLWGIFGPLRPRNPFPSPVREHGTEGTPLLENNQGVIYRRGSNADLRFSSEAFAGRYLSALVEPMFLYSNNGDLKQGRLNRGYGKLGGGGIELQVGRDENWLGFGFRGSGILTNNADNFDFVKLSNPEPISIKYLGSIKYDFIFSRFDTTGTGASLRRPYFFSSTILYKPVDILELGLNVSRQQGGPGVNNSLGSWFRGLYGGSNNDNSNNLANFEFRLRIPFLRNTELYGEDTFEDLPSAESYLAGIYIPRLTSSGKDDFRFEYFRGHNVLYTNGTFPEGYIYHGMPIGDSQGGATEDLFFRYSHWFAARNNIALEYFYTTRGTFGRLPGQAIERKHAGRAIWSLPLIGDTNLNLMYGWERVNNFDLVQGVQQTNQIVKVDFSYKY